MFVISGHVLVTTERYIAIARFTYTVFVSSNDNKYSTQNHHCHCMANISFYCLLQDLDFLSLFVLNMSSLYHCYHSDNFHMLNADSY